MEISENNYSGLVNAVSDALLVVNRKGEILWCNQQVKTLLNYQVSELTGKPLDTLLPQEFKEAHAVMLNQYFRHPISRPMGFSRPLEALTHSGKPLKVAIALAPIEWATEQCALAMLRCHHLDKSAVGSFESVRELFDDSQSISHIGAWDWDIEQRELFWSDQVFAMYGIDKSQGTPDYDAYLSLIHKDDRDAVKASAEAALTQNTPYLVSHRIVRGDMTVRHVIERGKVYRNHHGKPIRMSGTVQDVTDDYNYHMQLKIANSVFKHAFDGAINNDSKLNIIRTNPAFERMCGYRTSELCHSNLTDLIPELNSGVVMNAINRQGYWRGPLQCHKADGGTFPVHLSVAKIEDEAGPGTKFFVVTLSDISSIKKHEKQLQKLAYYDPLTSLYNRSYFIEKVSEFISTASGLSSGCAVLFIDLDGFKEVNDTQGHQEGDRLLVEIAEKLSRIVGEKGLLSRFGGDEFVILQKSENQADISHLAQMILDALSFTCDYGMYSFAITASIGIALYPMHGHNELELIKKADIAMYKAKYAGKNQFTFYLEEYGREKTDRLKLISDLEKAIHQQQVHIFLQPIVSSRNEVPFYFEALARWDHPETGPVSPAEFIPIAEETGLIIPLGLCLLRQVKEFMTAWRHNHLSEVKVSFNLSVSQLYDASLHSSVEEIFSTGEDKSMLNNLVFEITESSVMDKLDKARSDLLKLKKLGCSIAIDDFGTGYSSLSYLSRLPIDVVKIDRAFVRNITQNTENGSICRAIVSLSHSLRLEVIAEGIETEQEYLELKDMRCDKVQGYLIGRPAPAAEALKNNQGSWVN